MTSTGCAVPSCKLRLRLDEIRRLLPNVRKHPSKDGVKRVSLQWIADFLEHAGTGGYSYSTHTLAGWVSGTGVTGGCTAGIQAFAGGSRWIRRVVDCTGACGGSS
jgi:hypothetical protein